MKKIVYGLVFTAVFAMFIACSGDDEENGLSAGLYMGDEAISLDGVAGANILLQSLNYLESNAVEGGVYVIALDADITAEFTPSPGTLKDRGFAGYKDADGEEIPSPPYLLIDNSKNVTITLKSSGGQRTITLGNKGTLLQVGDAVSTPETAVTVILENIVLKGLQEGVNGATEHNNAPLVYVGGGGVLTLREGSAITGNYHKENQEIRGAGALVRLNGKLILDGGSITQNTGETTDDNSNGLGGGVCVVDHDTASFILKKGTVSHNSIVSTTQSARGGGVFVSGGSFIMEGGDITENAAKSANGTAQGGAFGAWVAPKELYITGGTIADNAALAVNGTAWAVNGMRISGFTVKLGGNPAITDAIALGDSAASIISLDDNFNPAGKITLDFMYGAQPAATAENPNPPVPGPSTGFGYKDRIHIKWTSGKTDALPDKFQLGEWLYQIAPFTKTPIAGSIELATGKYAQD